MAHKFIASTGNEHTITNYDLITAYDLLTKSGLSTTDACRLAMDYCVAKIEVSELGTSSFVLKKSHYKEQINFLSRLTRMEKENDNNSINQRIGGFA
jgi:hypothetical protein